MTSLLGRLRAAWYRIVAREQDASRRYWTERALKHGERAVLNLGHKDTAGISSVQHATLLPMLRARLHGDERVVLDYGCGPGRFTPALAETIHGRAVGVDPTEALVRIAPAAPNVEYHVLREGKIPLADASVDVLWLCLVLCCIVNDAELEHAVGELRRVLKPGGLVFLVENTSLNPDRPHIRFRTVQEYARLLPWAGLEPVGEYLDLGERISVLAGRGR